MRILGSGTTPSCFCGAALALAFSTLACSIDDRPLTVADSGAPGSGGGGASGSGGRNGGIDGASDGFGTSTGILLTPSSIGYYDGTNLAGVVGAWYAFGDYYDGGGVLAMPGMGSCPKAGFAMTQCSTVTTPTVSAWFIPDSNGKGMCTSGTAAKVVGLDGGAPDFADIWGAGIGFDLNNPGEASGGVGAKGQYDAPAHGITGIAFDIDTVPVGGHLRVEFPTQGTENASAYWGGATEAFSPIVALDHQEIRWPEVGGPQYVSSPPPFDQTKLQSVWFSVVSNGSSAVDYSFCINNMTALTN
jgi:hypothetical protein